MKKAIIALIFVSIFLVFTVARNNFTMIVGANPVPYPLTPNEELPTLVIHVPEIYSVSNGNYTLDFNFTLFNPESWNAYHMGFFPYVGQCSVSVYLDGVWKMDSGGTSATVNDYSVAFTNLTIDQHTVEIYLHAMTFSEIGTYRSELMQKTFFKINPASQTISFYEDPITIIRGQYPSSASSPSPDPTPTPTPILTPTPTSTPEPTPTPGTVLNLESLPTSLVIASSIPVVAVLIGLGLLVCLIKRK